jgi:dihydrofolate reductase
MVISVIAAVAEGSVIGMRGRIPWDLPADRAHFRRTTWGHPVLVGRRTFKTIGGPLPGRETVVLSRDASLFEPGCTVVSDLDTALDRFAGSQEEFFVAGGAQVYALALPRADRLYITRVSGRFDGDAFFPEVDWGSFERLRCEPLDGVPPSEFALYERVR